VDIIATEGEQGIASNLQRKAKQYDVMFDNLVRHMVHELHIETKPYGTTKERIPSWL
jgi:hypothetical protein